MENFTLSDRQREFVRSRFSASVPSAVKDVVLILLLADHHDWSYEELAERIDWLTQAVEIEYRLWRGME